MANFNILQFYDNNTQVHAPLFFYGDCKHDENQITKNIPR